MFRKTSHGRREERNGRVSVVYHVPAYSIPSRTTTKQSRSDNNKNDEDLRHHHHRERYSSPAFTPHPSTSHRSHSQPLHTPQRVHSDYRVQPRNSNYFTAPNHYYSAPSTSDHFCPYERLWLRDRICRCYSPLPFPPLCAPTYQETCRMRSGYSQCTSQEIMDESQRDDIIAIDQRPHYGLSIAVTTSLPEERKSKDPSLTIVHKGRQRNNSTNVVSIDYDHCQQQLQQQQRQQLHPSHSQSQCRKQEIAKATGTTFALTATNRMRGSLSRKQKEGDGYNDYDIDCQMKVKLKTHGTKDALNGTEVFCRTTNDTKIVIEDDYDADDDCKNEINVTDSESDLVESDDESKECDIDKNSDPDSNTSNAESSSDDDSENEDCSDNESTSSSSSDDSYKSRSSISESNDEFDELEKLSNEILMECEELEGIVSLITQKDAAQSTAIGCLNLKISSERAGMKDHFEIKVDEIENGCTASVNHDIQVYDPYEISPDEQENIVPKRDPVLSIDLITLERRSSHSLMEETNTSEDDSTVQSSSEFEMIEPSLQSPVKDPSECASIDNVSNEYENNDKVEKDEDTPLCGQAVKISYCSKLEESDSFQEILTCETVTSDAEKSPNELSGSYQEIEKEAPGEELVTKNTSICLEEISLEERASGCHELSEKENSCTNHEDHENPENNFNKEESVSALVILDDESSASDENVVINEISEDLSILEKSQENSNFGDDSRSYEELTVGYDGAEESDNFAHSFEEIPYSVENSKTEASLLSSALEESSDSELTFFLTHTRNETLQRELVTELKSTGIPLDRSRDILGKIFKQQMMDLEGEHLLDDPPAVISNEFPVKLEQKDVENLTTTDGELTNDIEKESHKGVQQTLNCLDHLDSEEDFTKYLVPCTQIHAHDETAQNPMRYLDDRSSESSNKDREDCLKTDIPPITECPENHFPECSAEFLIIGAESVTVGSDVDEEESAAVFEVGSSSLSSLSSSFAMSSCSSPAPTLLTSSPFSSTWSSSSASPCHIAYDEGICSATEQVTTVDSCEHSAESSNEILSTYIMTHRHEESDINIYQEMNKVSVERLAMLANDRFLIGECGSSQAPVVSVNNINRSEEFCSNDQETNTYDDNLVREISKTISEEINIEKEAPFEDKGVSSNQIGDVEESIEETSTYILTVINEPPSDKDALIKQESVEVECHFNEEVKTEESKQSDIDYDSTFELSTEEVDLGGEDTEINTIENEDKLAEQEDDPREYITCLSPFESIEIFLSPAHSSISTAEFTDFIFSSDDNCCITINEYHTESETENQFDTNAVTEHFETEIFEEDENAVKEVEEDTFMYHLTHIKTEPPTVSKTSPAGMRKVVTCEQLENELTNAGISKEKRDQVLRWIFLGRSRRIVTSATLRQIKSMLDEDGCENKNRVVADTKDKVLTENLHSQNDKVENDSKFSFTGRLALHKEQELSSSASTCSYSYDETISESIELPKISPTTVNSSDSMASQNPGLEAEFRRDHHRIWIPACGDRVSDIEGKIESKMNEEKKEDEMKVEAISPIDECREDEDKHWTDLSNDEFICYLRHHRTEMVESVKEKKGSDQQEITGRDTSDQGTYETFPVAFEDDLVAGESTPLHESSTSRTGSSSALSSPCFINSLTPSPELNASNHIRIERVAIIVYTSKDEVTSSNDPASSDDVTSSDENISIGDVTSLNDEEVSSSLLSSIKTNDTLNGSNNALNCTDTYFTGVSSAESITEMNNIEMSNVDKFCTNNYVCVYRSTLGPSPLVPTSSEALGVGLEEQWLYSSERDTNQIDGVCPYCDKKQIIGDEKEEYHDGCDACEVIYYAFKADVKVRSCIGTNQQLVSITYHASQGNKDDNSNDNSRLLQREGIIEMKCAEFSKNDDGGYLVRKLLHPPEVTLSNNFAGKDGLNVVCHIPPSLALNSKAQTILTHEESIID